MIIEKVNFTSSDGEHEIYAKLYLPDDRPPEAVMQIVHGMNEYKERYEPFVRYLTKHGIAAAIHDHLGHGQSARFEEELGFFGEKKGDWYLTEDVHRFYLLIKRRFPHLPYFLLGHSMGSFITRNYIAHFQDDLTGYICMGTRGSMLGAGIASSLAGFISKQYGPAYKSESLDKLTKMGFNARFKAEQDKMSWLSKDIKNRRAFGTDARSNFIFTAEATKNLIDLIRAVTGMKWADRVPRNLPVLIISGSEDPVGNYGKGPDQVAEWLLKAGLEDVTTKLFIGDRHEILNELDKDTVDFYILNWMKGIMGEESILEGKEDKASLFDA